MVDALHALAIGLEPDLTLILDLGPRQAARPRPRPRRPRGPLRALRPRLPGRGSAPASSRSPPSSPTAAASSPATATRRRSPPASPPLVDAMSEPDEPDRLPGAPHPRETAVLFGQDAAEATLPRRPPPTGRLPHAWLLTGPRGVGKATLAWRIARHLLAGEPAAQPRHGPRPPGLPPARRPRLAAALPRPPPLGRQGRAPAHRDHRRRGPRAQGLLPALRRRRRPPRRHRRRRRRAQRRRRQRAPEDPRGAAGPAPCSSSSATARPPSCRRCARAAASSACARSAPSRSPPPSRPPASPSAPTTPPPLAALAGGSVGAALGLVAGDGLARYDEIVALLAAAPLDRRRAIALAEAAAGRDAAARYALTLDLVHLALARLALAARAGPSRRSPPPRPRSSPGSAPPRPRAGSGPSSCPALAGRATHARAVNLDPAQVILDTFLQIDAAAAEARAHAA